MKQTEEKYRKKTSKYVFSWFWNFTSLAGFTQCRDTDTVISKGFWFILALTGWALTSYTTYSTILSFLAYDIVTKTTFETGQVFQSNVTFPSVTICNSNRVHCGHLYDLIYKCEKNTANCDRTPEDVETIYCGLFIRAQCPISLIEADRFTYGLGYTREVICDPSANESNCSCKEDKNQCKDGQWWQHCGTCKSPNESGECKAISSMLKENGTYFFQDEFIDKDGFFDLYLKLTAKEIATLAHQSKEMIKICTINDGANPDPYCMKLINGSKAIFSPRHGVCYMFNLVHQNQTNLSLTSDWPGPSTGLQIIIDVEGQYHMRNGLTPSTGAHIVIEYPSELPNVISEGIAVAPGAETTVSLKMSEIRRLEHPYGTCVDKIMNSEISTMYPSGFKYSAKSCNAFCVVVNTMRQCGCMLESEIGGIMLHEYDELTKDRPRCHRDSLCRGNPEKWFQPCHCDAECDDTFYHAQISSQKWPSDGLWPVFIDQMNITYNSTFFDATIYNTMLVDGSDATHGSMLEIAEQLRDYVENNFIKVNIFFRSLDNELVVETKKYPRWTDYLAALGGSVSLYLGASLLNVFEAIELVVRLVINSIINITNFSKNY